MDPYIKSRRTKSDNSSENRENKTKTRMIMSLKEIIKKFPKKFNSIKQPFASLKP